MILSCLVIKEFRVVSLVSLLNSVLSIALSSFSSSFISEVGAMILSPPVGTAFERRFWNSSKFQYHTTDPSDFKQYQIVFRTPTPTMLKIPQGESNLISEIF